MTNHTTAENTVKKIKFLKIIKTIKSLWILNLFPILKINKIKHPNKKSNTQKKKKLKVSYFWKDIKLTKRINNNKVLPIQRPIYMPVLIKSIIKYTHLVKIQNHLWVPKIYYQQTISVKKLNLYLLIKLFQMEMEQRTF